MRPPSDLRGGHDDHGAKNDDSGNSADEESWITMRGVPLATSPRGEQAQAAYRDPLEPTQRGELDVTPWLSRSFEQTAAALQLAETTVSRVIAKARYRLRFQRADLRDRQRNALNPLLEAGPGRFEGGMTIRKYSSLARVRRATGYRELAGPVAKGRAEPAGGAAQPRLRNSLGTFS